MQSDRALIGESSAILRSFPKALQVLSFLGQSAHKTKSDSPNEALRLIEDVQLFILLTLPVFSMNPLLRLSAPLILASQSPRRRALLKQRQVSFSVQVSPADESVEETLPPPDLAQTLAHQKAIPVAKEHPTALVLAADTIVAHQDTVLEKPNSHSEARRMLQQLSSSTHAVHTGMALHHRDTDRAITSTTTTHVTFGAISDEEIDAYVATGSPMDKAGGYGIQDHVAPFFIDRLDGDYYNVVGLPLRRLYVLLQQEFPDLIVTPQSP